MGRTARLQGFGLEELGIDTTGHTLPVDEHLQTVFPHILACGDVAGPHQFTHVAAHQAWYAAVNGLFGPFRRFKVDMRVIPWCTFLLTTSEAADDFRILSILLPCAALQMRDEEEKKKESR